MRRQAIIAAIMATWLGSGIALAPAVALAQNDEAEAGDIGEEISEAWDAIKDYSAEQKDAAVVRSRALLADIDEAIAAAQAQAATASDAAAEQWDATVVRLQELRADLAVRLEALEGSTADIWQRTKEGVGNAFAELRQAFADMDEGVDEEAAPSE